MRKWMIGGAFLFAWMTGVGSAAVSEPVYHFFSSLGSQGKMECWVSGEKFRTERLVDGAKFVYLFDGVTFVEYREGSNVAALMPKNEIPRLAVWHTEYQPRMGALTPGAMETVGSVACRSQTFSVKSRKGEIVITEWVDPVSRLVLKRDVTLGETRQTSVLQDFASLSSVPMGWFELPAGVKIPVSPKVGMRAENFSLKRHDTGEIVTLGALKGKKVVMLNFFATWCPPCHAEAPDFVKVYESFRQEGVEFISVDAGERPGTDPKVAVPEFAKKYGIQWPILMDEAGSPVSALYMVEGLPTNLVIDKEGVITFIKVGGMKEAELKTALGKALGRSKAAPVFNDSD